MHSVDLIFQREYDGLESLFGRYLRQQRMLRRLNQLQGLAFIGRSLCPEVSQNRPRKLRFLRGLWGQNQCVTGLSNMKFVRFTIFCTWIIQQLPSECSSTSLTLTKQNVRSWLRLFRRDLLAFSLGIVIFTWKKWKKSSIPCVSRNRTRLVFRHNMADIAMLSLALQSRHQIYDDFSSLQQMRSRLVWCSHIVEQKLWVWPLKVVKVRCSRFERKRRK